MFGRRKKKDEEASIAGLPAVNVSVVPSSDTAANVVPNIATPAPQVASESVPPEGTIPPVTTTTMHIDGPSTVIDARDVPGLREELLDVISHGGNPAEIQDIVMKAMSQGHAITGSWPATGGAISPPPPPAAEDPLDRLKKLNDLRVSGALTDAEFEAQKAKILGET
ncbi:MAG TPA: SHOCT domain-containing protein [Solirubrobacteraceae bacterium]|nr:SHOCT domain-containing protein [Solirubrobacteraceae bacterium]